MSKPEPGFEAGALRFDELPPVEHGTPYASEWWLAVGHLRAGSSEAFVSLVTVISMLGVTVGVALLNCVLSVMTGFEDDLRDKILGANAHVVVMRFGGVGMEVNDELLGTVGQVEGVRAAAPFIYSEMMLRSRFGSSGVVLKGIDPARTGEVTEVRRQIVQGLTEATVSEAQQLAVFGAMLAPVPGRSPDDEPLPGILLGDELMQALQVLPGDDVQLINPIGSAKGFLGMPTPTFRNFRVLGAFHSGMFEYDTKWAYVAIPEAQAFLKQEGLVTGVEIRVRDIDDVERIAREIEEKLGYPHYARHWRNLNQALFEALALEKIVMSAILGMVIVVAGMLIVSNLTMMVLTKRREIAILKAMGAGSASVMRVFVMIGAVIGLVGTSVGTVLGYLGCRFLAWYEWPLETDVYYLSSLPVVMEVENFIVVALVALLTCLVSTLYPAMRASAVDPVQGLRYE